MTINRWKRYCIPVAGLLFSMQLSACTMMFVSDEERPPDLSKIRVGTPRAEVEQALGKPLYEIRPEFGSRAARKCEYQYLVKDQVKPDRSFWTKVNDAMSGFRQIVVTVYYDLQGRVVRIQKREARDEPKRA